VTFDQSVERKHLDVAKKPNGKATEQTIIDELAGLPELDYQLQRSNVALGLGLNVGALDKLVKRARKPPPEPPLYPHWHVEPASEPVDAKRLLTRLIGCIRSHVVMPEESARVVALWIAMTWVHDVAAVHSPILLVTSPEPNSGKTTLLGVLSFLVRRSVRSVGISAAALYRAVEKWKPTIMVEEADTAFVENDDLRQVVNSGWTRGDGVLRCDGENNDPYLFPTFCPKAIGMKGRKLPDTIMSRAIVIEMARKKPSERAIDFEYVDDDSLKELRSDLAQYAADNADLLRRAHPALPQGFENRRAANWRLLLAIADTGGQEWGRKARAAAEKIAGAPVGESTGTDLLTDIRKLFDAKPDTDRILSRQLIEMLTADPENRWCEWGRDRKPITQKQLAGLLKPFGVISENVTVTGYNQAKGYKRSAFKEAWERYLAGQNPACGQVQPSDPSIRLNADGKGTSRTFSSVHESSADGSKNAHLFNVHAALDAWTDRKPEKGSGGESDHDNGCFGSRLCDHCRGSETPADPLTAYDWDGYPEGILLHHRCEGLVRLDASRPGSGAQVAPMTARALSDTRPVPRRGLSRDEAAMYVGISPGKFDDLVADGRMPAPVKIDGRKLWDLRRIDVAFDALMEDGCVKRNSWDGV
jgi:putative DNA primase/helicase